MHLLPQPAETLEHMPPMAPRFVRCAVFAWVQRSALPSPRGAHRPRDTAAPWLRLKFPAFAKPGAGKVRPGAADVQ
jgi:hypothetical protein